MTEEKKSKVNWDKVVKITTMVMAACGLTLGTVAYIVADHYATEYMVAKVEDDRDRFHLAIKDMVTTVVQDVTAGMDEKILDELLVSSAKYNKIYNSMSGFKGMNDDALTEYLKETFTWADSIKVMMPTIMENHDWVVAQRDGSTASEYTRCGIVLAKDDEPKYFLDCDGTRRKISYGRPSGVNLNSGKKVYYYRNDDDKAILISYLSNY